MRKILFGTLLLAAGVTLAAEVSNVVVKISASGRVLDVRYRLLDGPAIITVDVQTNTPSGGWATIGERNLKGFAGDVYRRLPTSAENESYRMSWNASVYWTNHVLDPASSRVVVTAWAVDAPPDYMVIDLFEPFGVSWYPSEDRLPGKNGVRDSVYKERYVVMRKIPAKDIVWNMGTPPGSYFFSVPDNEAVHKVKLTSDYYIGVYPLTKAQSDRLGRTDGYVEENTADASYRKPLNSYERSDMRGDADGAKWPTFTSEGQFDRDTSSKVDASSWLGKFRARYESYGIRIDLPTEAQWEFACHAGCGKLLYTGKSPNAENTYELGRFKENAELPAYADCEGGMGSTPAVVGSFKPNAWGLYDMLGNVHEECLDVYEDFSTSIERTAPIADHVYVDPVGGSRNEEGANMRIFRGASYGSGWTNGRSGGRVYRYSDADDRYVSQGYRLCWTLPLKEE